jgi:hypothetical protein
MSTATFIDFQPEIFAEKRKIETLIIYLASTPICLILFLYYKLYCHQTHFCFLLLLFTKFYFKTVFVFYSTSDIMKQVYFCTKRYKAALYHLGIILFYLI